MFRMPYIAIVSLFLAVPAIAQNPAAEPPVCLEATAVKIMLKAFQVGDHDTVEMLFAKLPLESKKKFLHEATEAATVCIKKMITENDGDLAALPFADMQFAISLAMMQVGSGTHDTKQRAEIFQFMLEMFGNYAVLKKEQTQLLGRLTASLLGQEAVVAASQSEEEHYYHVVIQVTTDKEMSTRVERFPVNSNERVTDALGHVNFRDFTDDVRIWLARPAPCSNRPVILPVCLQDIASNGEAKTNHLLQPNDRLFVNVSPVADRRIIFLPGGQFGVWASGVIRTLR